MTSAAATALLHLASAVILLAALSTAAPHLGQYDDAGLEEVAAQLACDSLFREEEQEAVP